MKSVADLKLNPSGRGLSLYVCDRLCKTLSGEIKCTSVPDQFTTFTFKMQAVQIQEEEIRNLALSGRAHSYLSFDMGDDSASENLILVAEDYFLNRLAMRTAINDLVTVDKDKMLFAGNGNQAYKMIQKSCVGQRNMFAVLFLDLDLPEESGVDLVLKVKQLYITRQITELPEIILTCSSPMESLISFAKKEQITLLRGKPTPVEEIKAVLTRAKLLKPPSI